MRTLVLAFGGNALVREKQAGTFEEQRRNAGPMAELVTDLLAAGYRVIITHGNGPQVGNLAVQQEEGQRFVPPQPLFALGAMTQGQIGNILSLGMQLSHSDRSSRVVSVVTHVVVDPEDPAFGNPTKPIGPFFDAVEAEQLGKERGWAMIEDAGRGYRRVVPSPEPLTILETDAIRSLVDSGYIVIAAGGGGIPVVRQGETFSGVEAVIDKDFAAERLAASLAAHALILVTGVDQVVINFRTPQERPIEQMTVDEAERHLADGQFPPGSMGPKVTAAIRFVRDGGQVGIITTATEARAALEGRHGTRIVAAVSPEETATP